MKREMRLMPFEKRLEFVSVVSDQLHAQEAEIFAANKIDCERFSANLEPTAENIAIAQQMFLTEDGFLKMRQDIRDILTSTDYNNSLMGEWETLNRVTTKKVRTPFGRINVAVRAAPSDLIHSTTLPIVSGNAVTVRPSGLLEETSKTVLKIMTDAAVHVELPEGAVEVAGDQKMYVKALGMKGKFDMNIVMHDAAGGSDEALIRRHSHAPVVVTGDARNYLYIHSDAEPVQVSRILKNAKIQQPSSQCALHHILLHTSYPHISQLLELFEEHKVRVVRDEGTQKRLAKQGLGDLQGDVVKKGALEAAFVDTRVTLRFVPALEEAVKVINRHSTHHQSTILCQAERAAEDFLEEVDSAVVLHNTSPLLADAEGLGLGAGLGVNDSLGPLSVKELLTTRYIVESIGRTKPEENLKANPLLQAGKTA